MIEVKSLDEAIGIIKGLSKARFIDVYAEGKIVEIRIEVG